MKCTIDNPQKPDAGNLLALVGLSLFFLMLFVPTSYKEIKAVLLVGLFFGILLGLLYGIRFRIHLQVFILFLFYTFLGMAYVFYGYIKGNPGAVRVSTVYVIWPIVYMVIISTMSKEWVFRSISRVLIGSSIAISLYIIYYLLHELGIVPDALYLELDLGQSAGFYEELVRYNLYSISTLLFLFPFVTASLLSWSGVDNPPVRRKYIMISFLLVTCVSILSGRRALWLVMPLTPLLTSVILLFVKQRQGTIKKILKPFFYFAGIVGVSLALLQTVFDVGVSGLLNRLVEGFQFSDDLGAVLRREQYVALLDGWAYSPFFGGRPGGGGGRADPIDGNAMVVRVVFHFSLVPHRDRRYRGICIRDRLDPFPWSKDHQARFGVAFAHDPGAGGDDMLPGRKQYQSLSGQIRLPVGGFPAGCDHQSLPAGRKCPEARGDKTIMAVDIVVVNWNSGRQLQACIESVIAFGDGLVGKIIIVDNGSTDDSLNFGRSGGEITVIRAGENLGFATACNRGAAEATPTISCSSIRIWRSWLDPLPAYVNS